MNYQPQQLDLSKPNLQPEQLQQTSELKMKVAAPQTQIPQTPINSSNEFSGAIDTQIRRFMKTEKYLTAKKQVATDQKKMLIKPKGVGKKRFEQRKSSNLHGFILAAFSLTILVGFLIAKTDLF